MSSLRVMRPREKRTVLRAFSGSSPIAVKTCDGSSEPDAVEAKARVVRQAFAARAVERAMRDARENAIDELVAQRDNLVALHIAHGKFKRNGESDDAGDVLGAGAPAALLAAAEDERLEAHAVSHVQRADAFRSLELVRRKRQRVHAKLFDVDRDVTDRLHGVGVEQRAVGVRDRSELRDGLHRSDLVIRMHDRDKRGNGVFGRACRGALRERSHQRFLAHKPFSIDRHDRDAVAARAQLLGCVQDGVMLDRARDEMALCASVRIEHAEDRKTVGF